MIADFRSLIDFRSPMQLRIPIRTSAINLQSAI
jgi:hypothetical protein